jgi:uncharacterized protein (DUF2249 family)
VVISAGDRVSAVLARDERLVEVFTSLSPTFERLRNPAMRKVMARLVTIEQAARMAGLEPELLVERLNQALAATSGISEHADDNHDTKPRSAPGAPVGAGERAEMATDTLPDGIPAALAAVPAELIVDIDVRPDLRRGEEPFSKIMAARREVRPGGVLRLSATFEPVPLYAVLGKQGLEHWTERFADDDWRVWFYAPAAAAASATPAAPATPAAAAAPAADPEDDVVIIDVRGLEPPEPMVRTFEALEQLPVGKTLLQLNVRVPQFLLPQLAARGFTYEIREQSKELVRIFIRHAASAE